MQAGGGRGGRRKGQHIKVASLCFADFARGSNDDRFNCNNSRQANGTQILYFSNVNFFKKLAP